MHDSRHSVNVRGFGEQKEEYFWAAKEQRYGPAVFLCKDRLRSTKEHSDRAGLLACAAKASFDQSAVKSTLIVIKTIILPLREVPFPA